MSTVALSPSDVPAQQAPQNQHDQQDQQQHQHEQSQRPKDFYGTLNGLEEAAQAEMASHKPDAPCPVQFVKLPNIVRIFMMCVLGFDNFATDVAFHRPRFTASQVLLSAAKDEADFTDEKLKLRRWSCAVRCNARYTNSNAAYFCERAYVRDLIVRAAHTFFLRTVDGNPIFYMFGISAKSDGKSKDRKPWREIREAIHNVNANSTVEQADGRVFFKQNVSATKSYDPAAFANARTSVVFSGAPEQMGIVRDALQKLSDDLDEQKRKEVLGDETSEPKKKRTQNENGTNDGVTEADNAAMRAQREQVHAREVQSYELGNVKIAAYLTVSEAEDFAKRYNVCVMPLKYIENYEDADEMLNLSLRYRRRVDVLQENGSLVKIQHAIPGTFTFYTSYTTVRVRLPRTITPEDINKIREIVGGDNTTLNIIPDSPSIAPEPAARVSQSVANPNRKSAWKKVPEVPRPQKSTVQKRFLVFDAALPIEVVDDICQDEKVTRIANLTQDFESNCNTFVVQWDTADGTPQPDESGHGTARVIEFAGREVIYQISKQRKPQYE